MQCTKELTDILIKSISLDKRRLTCLAGMIMALMVVRTISLPRIVTAIAGGGKASSWYRRAQRFFADAQLSMDEVARLLFGLFFDETCKVALTIDRTNWKFGCKNINLLVLGVVYKGAAIPVMWQQLDKAGNSNTRERKALLERFITLFGLSCIKELYADREFIGKDWFYYLLKKNIPFSIRIKGNSQSHNSKGRKVSVKQLFRNIGIGEQRSIPSPRTLWQCSVYLSATKLQNGTLLIVASTSAPASAVHRYRLRWEIEIFFECLKGRGFHFEDTRITKKERIEKLLAVLSIAYAWGYKVGEWSQRHIKPIRLKNHKRPEVRIFRRGIDMLKQAILGTDFTFHWNTLLRLLLHKQTLYKNTS